MASQQKGGGPLRSDDTHTTPWPYPSRHRQGRVLRWISVRLSIGSATEQQSTRRANEEHEIQPYGPVRYIGDVHLNPLSKGCVVASGYLPWSGDPWSNAQYLALGRPYVGGLARQVRARPY